MGLTHAIFSLSLILAAPDKKTPLKHSSLLPDNRGRISHLLIHFADYDNIPTLYGLLRQLPLDTLVTIAAPQGERTKLLNELLAGWKIKNKKRLQIVSPKQAMTFWIRDEFVAAEDSKIVMPKRYGIESLPESIAELAKLVKLTPLHSLVEFDGGNIVTSEKYIFIGYNLIENNRRNLFDDDNDMISYLEQLFGRKVVVVGGAAAPSPHEHIDMILTPLVGDKLLVGDPRLAIETMKNHSVLMQATYGKVYFNEALTPIPTKAKQLLFQTDDFVRRLNAEQKTSKLDAIKGDDDITLALLYAKNSLPAELDKFDKMVANLKTKGFKDIVRIPVLMNHDIENGPFITYNNMLLEEDNGKRIVYLPTYNLAPLDQLAKSIMTQLGYEVRAVDVQNIAFYNGTLRCVTQVLKRSP